MVYDVTMAALHASLSGLSARRRVLAQNVANVDTPGYLARTVEFEDSLSAELAAARRGRAGRDSVRGVTAAKGFSLQPTRLNGNNVNLDDEVVAQTVNDLSYNAVLEAMNGKFRLLRTAISEGR